MRSVLCPSTRCLSVNVTLLAGKSRDEKLADRQKAPNTAPAKSSPAGPPALPDQDEKWGFFQWDRYAQPWEACYTLLSPAFALHSRMDWQRRHTVRQAEHHHWWPQALPEYHLIWIALLSEGTLLILSTLCQRKAQERILSWQRVVGPQKF